MATNEELEKRIETLEKEVQHLKAVLQYQMRNKKKWFIHIALIIEEILELSSKSSNTLMLDLDFLIKEIKKRGR